MQWCASMLAFVCMHVGWVHRQQLRWVWELKITYFRSCHWSTPESLAQNLWPTYKRRPDPRRARLTYPPPHASAAQITLDRAVKITVCWALSLFFEAWQTDSYHTIDFRGKKKRGCPEVIADESHHYLWKPSANIGTSSRRSNLLARLWAFLVDRHCNCAYWRYYVENYSHVRSCNTLIIRDPIPRGTHYC